MLACSQGGIMKRVIMALFILAAFTIALANPIEYKLVGKLWFSQDDELMLQFRQMLCGQDDKTVTISDGTNIHIEIVNFSQPEPPIMTIPAGFFSRDAGYLSVSVGDFSPEEISWGASTDNHFCPLEGTQTATQLLIYNPESSYYKFAKDYNPTCGSEFNTLARSTINVHVRNQNGTPVPAYPITLDMMYPPAFYTDADGNASFSYYSAKLNLRLLYPNSWIAECDTTFFAEPDETYNIDFQITSVAADDQYISSPSGTFSTYPSVLRQNNSYVNLVYNGKLGATAQVKLYDLKGRLIMSQEYPGNDMAIQLPRLSSGIYFLRLCDGERVLGSSKLTVLK
jgi:hypothetical protein